MSNLTRSRTQRNLGREEPIFENEVYERNMGGNTFIPPIAAGASGHNNNGQGIPTQHKCEGCGISSIYATCRTPNCP
ncbi:hypothetical protein DL93DRAFT_2153267, partial [Clavulina sp. PMI_390]